MVTKYGLPQVAVIPGVLVCAMAALGFFFRSKAWVIPVEALLLLALIWTLSFFRDPKRVIAADDAVLYSPCDGTVTEVASEDGVIRVSVFLSIFSVHINRAPCDAVVSSVTYKKGEYRNAMDPESARINESNEIEMVMRAYPEGMVVVRQVSGAIARRIVCKAENGDELKQGDKFGMIKFGSRTELILHGGPDSEVCVKPGDKVKAGLTVLIRFSQAVNNE